MLHSTGWQIWANSLARLDPMAGGILLAVLLRNNAVVLKSLTRLALVACGAGFIVLTGYIVDLSPRITPMGVLVSYPVVAASCTAVVFAFINWSIRSHALEYLGKISYGLYVYHQSCIRITDRILTPQPGALHTLLRPTVSLVIAVLVSAISYGVLEAPFLKLKRKFTHISSRPV
jgi:peptidoglycan/LPS O-acetylase OafA/YrhL